MIGTFLIVKQEVPMTQEKVSPLRERMMEDMRIRGMQETSQKAQCQSSTETSRSGPHRKTFIKTDLDPFKANDCFHNECKRREKQPERSADLGCMCDVLGWFALNDL